MSSPRSAPELISDASPEERGALEVEHGASAATGASNLFEQRDRFNELLISLCVDFINRPVEQVADGLSDALRRIGVLTQVDRCFIYRFSEDGSTVSLAHEWVAEGVASSLGFMQQVPAEKFAWEAKQILTKGHLYVPDVGELPEEAVGLRWLYAKIGVKSAANIAMVVDGRLVGVLGFSSVRERRPWAEQELALGQVLAEVLVSVLERSRADQALHDAQEDLRRRLGFENLILSLSTRFINLPLEQFDAEFNDALRQVTEFTGVARTYVYLLDNEKLEARLHDVWSAEGAPPLAESWRTLKEGKYAWGLAALREGHTVHIPVVSDLPEEASEVREDLLQRGFKSFITVPMRLDDKVLGYLGCSCVDQPKTWSEDEIALLRLLAEVLINALKRRETQEALATSERRLRLTVESVEEGMFDWDIQSGQAYISDYLKRGVGLSVKEEGWDFDGWSDRIYPDDRERVMANLSDHLEGRAALYDVEYRFRTENRGYRWMHSRGRVVEHLPDGQPLRMVGVQRDITPQIEQREEQRSREEQMMHLGRVATMGETVAGIAHEINQPLHAASTYCAAAREAARAARPNSTEKVMDLCDQAAAQVSRAGDIIHRLREFTRPRPTEIGGIDLNELVTQTLEFADQLGKLRGVKAALELEAAPLRVRADKVQIQQVLINLIQNACDSFRDSDDSAPAMVISTRRGSGHAEVTVRDNASSPLQVETETLFDAFYTTKPDGMGIGLALCRTILTAHVGEITAEINTDRGMTFRFTLPLEEETSL